MIQGVKQDLEGLQKIKLGAISSIDGLLASFEEANLSLNNLVDRLIVITDKLESGLEVTEGESANKKEEKYYNPGILYSMDLSINRYINLINKAREYIVKLETHI